MIRSGLESLVAAYARQHLSPTAQERNSISDRYEELQDLLEGRTFQSGSYARFTANRPVNDLDVIYLLPDSVLKAVRATATTINPDSLDIHDIIESLASELRKHYADHAIVKPQPHSVGIFFGKEHEFSIDVVPSLPADNEKIWVPEIARRSITARRGLYASGKTSPGPNWIKSHPKGYIAQAANVDATSGGRFRKSAKILKKWRWNRKRADEQFCLKSFHLELAITRWFQTTPESSCVDAVRGIVEGLPALITRPQFPDLADASKFVDSYLTSLTPAGRRALEAAFATASELWATVEGAHSDEDADIALGHFLDGSRPDAQRPLLGLSPTHSRDPGEQFLSDHGIQTRLTHRVRIDATVMKDGFRPFSLRGYLHRLLKLRSLAFRVIACDVPRPYTVKWKVKNTGDEAVARGDLRGQIYDDAGQERRVENTKYWGDHYVECYVIKDGVCIAADHIDVPIGPN